VHRQFDFVITVCDQAADESCPVVPSTYRKLHWSTPDLAKANGNVEEIDRSFEDAFRQLKERIHNELMKA
jgi:arsenate reductase